MDKIKTYEELFKSFAKRYVKFLTTYFKKPIHSFKMSTMDSIQIGKYVYIIELKITPEKR